MIEEREIDWLGDAAKLLEACLIRLVGLADDQTQRADVRAKATELISRVHQEISNFPATMSEPDRYGWTAVRCFNVQTDLDEVIKPRIPQVAIPAISTPRKLRLDEQPDSNPDADF